MDYRVYFRGTDGHIKSAADIDCENDAAAITEATVIAKGAHVELWRRARRVTTLNEPQSRQA